MWSLGGGWRPGRGWRPGGGWCTCGDVDGGDPYSRTEGGGVGEGGVPVVMLMEVIPTVGLRVEAWGRVVYLW